MRPVRMGCYDKSMTSLCKTHCQFIADLIRFLRRNFSRLERLSDLIGDHILLLLSPGDMKILAFCKKKFFICSTWITLVGTDIFSVFCFSSVLSILQSVCETLRYRLSFVDMQRNQTGHCHSCVRLPSPTNAAPASTAAACQTLARRYSKKRAAGRQLMNLFFIFVF